MTEGTAPTAATQEITLTLLLSLRCLGLVFEDLRNLALGLAVRGIDWSKTNAVLVRLAASRISLAGIVHCTLQSHTVTKMLSEVCLWQAPFPY